MSAFCLLRDSDAYAPLNWDLLADEAARKEWLDLFEKVFAEILHYARQRYGRMAEGRIEDARKQFEATFSALRKDPASASGGKLDLMVLDRLRDDILRENHIDDPFGRLKERENEAALDLYPHIVRELHAMEAEDKWLHLIETVLAGNTFDMGATETMGLGADPRDFLDTIESVKPRPWLIDDSEVLLERLAPAPPTPWARAVIFVDNAGTDFVLGVMPFARELALGGTQIVLAANEQPSLNDITVDEVVDMVGAVGAADNDLRALVEVGMFEVVSTGTDLPVLDLSDVSDELNAAAEGADLVVLVGMGRAIETNLDAEFSVDAIRIGLIKNETVARHMGGELFDCVCKYTAVEE